MVNMMNRALKKCIIKERHLLALYLIWVMLHLTIFLVGGAVLTPDEDAAGYFWPFPTKYEVVVGTSFDLSDPLLSGKIYKDFCTYDITELIIYTVFPILLYKVKCLLFTSDKLQNKNI